MHSMPGNQTTAVDRYRSPVSFGQHRLWFLEQLSPTGSAYILANVLHLTGPLDVIALEKAIDHLVQRHASLRTSFEMLGNDPMQVVTLDSIVDVPTADLTNCPDQRKWREVQSLIDKEVSRPFDLTVAPLLRVLLIRLNSQEHVLSLCVHHIVTDGWSMGVFFRELTIAYNAYHAGREPELEHSTVQYTRYVIQQRERLKGETLERLLTYWRRQLRNAPSVLELPADRPRPPIQSYRGARITRQLSEKLLARVKSLCRNQNCTLFMTLLAAFEVLLHRYTGQCDFVIGSPIAGRTRSDLKNVIGFFANTLLIRAIMNDDPTFEDLLQRVRETCLDAFSHQDVPFEKLVKELNPDRDLSRPPLFQVLFALQNARRQTPAFDGIEAVWMPADSKTARFDLSLKITEHDDTLTANFEYSTDLFDYETVERMARHFEILLEGIAVNPKERISRLPLLSANETHQILVEWNDTQTEYPRDSCIQVLFQEQVAYKPDAVAVVKGNQALTYSELDERAERLSRYLRTMGVGPEVVVGLCMNRSLEMTVAMLGILRAGGVYLPLDPDNPAERLAFMLNDTNTSVVVTIQPLASRIGDFGGRVLCLDRDWRAIETAPDCSPHAAPTADNLAYIMYTSGSSGHPKGVGVPHRGVVRLVKGQDYVDIDADDIFLQFAPISFDASTFEIWGCLLNGGKLVLFDEEETPEALVRIVEHHGVTVLWLTAGLFHLLTDSRIGALKSVRQLLVGGDVVSVSHVQKAFEALPGCQLINGYGPTENTTFTCCYHITEPNSLGMSVPIGRPIANTRAFILDSKLQPVPIGVAGELFVGGDGLARGYVNRPKLNKSSFIQGLLDHDPSARLYRTGDLARYLPEGVIEFLGRKDDQTKIRGYRIEPGEIEVTLMEHERVDKCIVLVKADPPHEKRLVAYVVPIEDQMPTLDELRSYLARKLPAYMVPSAFVPVETFPLTPNGKVDRQALEALDEGRQTEQVYVPPRTSTERTLAKIWQKVMWLEHDVGVYDNFFDLGGHSLLSVQLVDEIEKVFNQKLSISALFQLSTIAELATELEGKESGETAPVQRFRPPALAPEIYRQLFIKTAGWGGQRISPEALMIGLNMTGAKQPLFWCVQGFLELSQLAKYMGTDRPIYGMRSGHLVMKYTPETVEALAAHYVEEIMNVDPAGPYLLGGNCQAAPIAFEVADQLQSHGGTITLLCSLERFVPRFYQGKRALFFGSDSEFNPYKSFHSPELGWGKFCPEGFTLDIVPGVHGRFFDEPNIQVLVERLESRISTAQEEQANQPAVNTTARIPSKDAYQAVITARSTLSMSPGQRVPLAIDVHNVSSEIWPRTKESGIVLGNHWWDVKGDLISWLDGIATLDDEVQPAESVEVMMAVTAPSMPGRYILELDLAEEGITWFSQKGSKTALITVQVSEVECDGNPAQAL